MMHIPLYMEELSVCVGMGPLISKVTACTDVENVEGAIGVDDALE